MTIVFVSFKVERGSKGTLILSTKLWVNSSAKSVPSSCHQSKISKNICTYTLERGPMYAIPAACLSDKGASYALISVFIAL